LGCCLVAAAGGAVARAAFAVAVGTALAGVGSAEGGGLAGLGLGLAIGFHCYGFLVVYSSVLAFVARIYRPFNRANG
jgi:hypothetical protein